MNKNKVRLFVACGAIVVLLSACGNAAGVQNENVQNASTDNMINTQLDAETTDTTKTTEETPQLSVGGGVSTRPKDEIDSPSEVTPEEEPKKNFFETIIDTVTGWFGGGSDSDKEQNAVNVQQTTENTQSSTQATTNTEQETDAPEQSTGGTEETPGESTEPTAPGEDVLTYEEYLALSAAERMAYYESFGDPEAFTLWFQAAKEAYNNGSAIEIGGGGSIDLTP